MMRRRSLPGLSEVYAVPGGGGGGEEGRDHFLPVNVYREEWIDL